MIPLQKNSRFIQGVFVPKNENKYVGKKPIIYRSSYELKFFRFCDDNPNVSRWASESIKIPYFHPFEKSVRQYHVDLNMVIKEGEAYKKYLVEIKPEKQTRKPDFTNSKCRKATMLYEQMTYVTNCAKWEAAKKFAKMHDMQFIILTEKNLKINPSKK
jgi:hypothetical protein